MGVWAEDISAAVTDEVSSDRTTGSSKTGDDSADTSVSGTVELGADSATEACSDTADSRSGTGAA